MSATLIEVAGFRVLKGFLGRAAQEEMVADIREVVRQAPLFAPTTPWGKPMRVRMTSAGSYGWYSDRSGYRYVSKHPTGRPWPEIPTSVMAVWTAVAGSARAPECCLINFYDATAKMGLHQDKDEADFSLPVVSVSLGDPATFRMGGPKRGDPTTSILLESGDVVVIAGAARQAFHGVDRIHPGRSTLLPDGGRINLTLRVVT